MAKAAVPVDSPAALADNRAAVAGSPAVAVDNQVVVDSLEAAVDSLAVAVGILEGNIPVRALAAAAADRKVADQTNPGLENRAASGIDRWDCRS